MNAFSNTTRAISVAVLAAAFALNVGCTKMTTWKPSKMFSLDNTWPFRDKDAPHEGVPVRMVGTWTDTVLSKVGEKPQRGFGGRIMFYEKDETQPILVDGQLVVYAFDETGRETTDNKPTRRYVFPAEQMPVHMSKSELGASYSFWLPWDEAGGPRTEVSLICRFEPKGGPVVSSEQTKHLLPGSMAPPQVAGAKQPPKLPEGVASKPRIQTLESLQAQRNARQPAQLASYETAAPGNPQAAGSNASQDANLLPTKRLTATTINLPGNFVLPNATAFTNQTMSAAGNVQPPLQPTQQPLPNQQLPQQTPTTYSPAVPTNALQQMGQSRPFAGTQPALNTFGFTQQTPQFPLNSQSATMPATQPMMPGPANFATSQVGQTQVQPQGIQQTNLQQQLLQQQLMQQQSLQQQSLQR